VVENLAAHGMILTGASALVVTMKRYAYDHYQALLEHLRTIFSKQRLRIDDLLYETMKPPI
jgi:hypothetical protein